MAAYDSRYLTQADTVIKVAVMAVETAYSVLQCSPCGKPRTFVQRKGIIIFDVGEGTTVLCQTQAAVGRSSYLLQARRDAAFVIGALATALAAMSQSQQPPMSGVGRRA